MGSKPGVDATRLGAVRGVRPGRKPAGAARSDGVDRPDIEPGAPGGAQSETPTLMGCQLGKMSTSTAIRTPTPLYPGR